MTQEEKDTILAEARGDVRQKQAAIDEEIRRIEIGLGKAPEDVSELEAQENRLINEALVAHERRRRENLLTLRPSPFFSRCDVHFEDENETKSLYFARHSFSEGGIFSWTTPASAIRFEEPGPVSYETPEDGVRSGTLLRKDQYMIVDGAVVFLASESTDVPRQLIYQEYLSSRQGAFMLPEIVAQMEKAQDQVIRAHHAGPFVISGPAGSGKTTLALHRVAFLTQSPETAVTYPARSLIVFVQDDGTKDYFSHLLPQLGIHNVRITTFSEWALELLGLDGWEYADRIGANERERDAYEYAKSKAVAGAYRKGAEMSLLEAAYGFDGRFSTLLAKQKRDRILDRYDLTLLVSAASRRENGFVRPREVSTLQKNGQMKREMKMVRVEYPLMVIDEFQNYLPEQLRIFDLCLKQKPGSILYVGDMAQRTRFGTIRNWAEVDRTIHPDRTVRLQKVYRNTRQILEYVRGRGYDVEIPDGIKTGPEVPETECWSAGEEISYIEGLGERSVGVISLNPDRLLPHSAAFAGRATVRVMTAREAQGVEFDIVVLLDEADIPGDEAGDFETERQTIRRDLTYVALTRAISELHVLTKA
jgi:DNA helicase IV